RVDHQRRMRSAGRTERLIDADVDLRDHRIAVEGAEPATAAAGQILGLVHLCEAHGAAVEAARQLLLAAGHRHLHVMQSHGGSLVAGWSEQRPRTRRSVARRSSGRTSFARRAKGGQGLSARFGPGAWHFAPDALRSPRAWRPLSWAHP